MSTIITSKHLPAEQMNQVLAQLLSLKSYIPSSIASYSEKIPLFPGQTIIDTIDHGVDTALAISQAAQKENLLPYLEDKVLSFAESSALTEEERSLVKSPSTSGQRLANLSDSVSKKLYTSVSPQIEQVRSIPVTVTASFKSATSLVDQEFQKRVVKVAQGVLTEHKDEKETIKATFLISALVQQFRIAADDFIITPTKSSLGVEELSPAAIYTLLVNTNQVKFFLATLESRRLQASEAYSYAIALPATLPAKATAAVTSVITTSKDQVSAYYLQVQVYVSHQVDSAVVAVIPYVSVVSSRILPYLPTAAVKVLETYAPLLLEKKVN